MGYEFFENIKEHLKWGNAFGFKFFKIKSFVTGGGDHEVITKSGLKCSVNWEISRVFRLETQGIAETQCICRDTRHCARDARHCVSTLCQIDTNIFSTYLLLL